VSDSSAEIPVDKIVRPFPLHSANTPSTFDPQHS
jgi:hypothetical protein